MQCAYTFILFIHICTEPTGFIIAIGSDPDSYKGSQLSLPPADNQWYKGDDGDGGEGTNGKDSADGEVGADDDQLLKTPPPLPPALPPLPQADPHWYKSGDESKGVKLWTFARFKLVVVTMGQRMTMICFQMRMEPEVRRIQKYPATMG